MSMGDCKKFSKTDVVLQYEAQFKNKFKNTV